MQSVIVFFMTIATLMLGISPAQANNTRTVDAHEYDRVAFHDGMSRAKVHSIFDSRGVLVKQLPTKAVTVGAWQERWYDNACDDSPVAIQYTFRVDRWVVSGWDAYYPHSYPRTSHACLYPHPDH